MLAQLAARDLVPELWIPSLGDRELRERLRRREHLVRPRTSARNRMFGLLTQWELRGNLRTLRKPDALRGLSGRGVPAVWIESVQTLLEVVDDLDRQITQIERELRSIARADPRVQLLATIPGLGPLLALTITAEIGDIARFSNARKLIGYAGLAPTIKSPGRAPGPDRSPRPGHQPCAGPLWKPPSTPGGPATPGTGSTSRPRPGTATPTPPGAPSPARS